MREFVYMLTLIDQRDTLRAFGSVGIVRAVGTLGPVGTVRAVGALGPVGTVRGIGTLKFVLM